jgi:hypothetical protein
MRDLPDAKDAKAWFSFVVTLTDNAAIAADYKTAWRR